MQTIAPQTIVCRAATRSSGSSAGNVSGTAARAVPIGSLHARGQVEPVEDARDVALDGVRTQVEGTCDQLVALAVGEQREDLEFPAAEACFVGCAGVRPLARAGLETP